MTVTGVGNVNCDCSGCNVSAFVPASQETACESGFFYIGGIECDPGGFGPGFFAWQIECTGNVITVSGLYSLVDGEADSISILRSYPKGTPCADMSASGNDVPFPPNPFDNFCNWQSAVLTMVPVVV